MMVKLFLFIAHTSHHLMGTAKNYLTLFAELKNLILQYQKQKLQLRQLLRNLILLDGA